MSPELQADSLPLSHQGCLWLLNVQDNLLFYGGKVLNFRYYRKNMNPLSINFP